MREADASGNVTASFSYAPYGSLYSGPNQSQPGFTGHVNDPETAFTYMQARYYDAGAGHMLNVDPVGPVPGDVFGFNRYAYANNNPVVNIDPTGMESLWVQSGSHTNIVIPVHFVGEGATKDNVTKIIAMAKAMEILDRRYSISIVSTGEPVSGALNTMDLSRGYRKEFSEAGEGVNMRGGNTGHINTENKHWLRAALHDILHFASFKDGYISMGKGSARVIVGYLNGYSVDNIMASRGDTGNEISQDEIRSADQYGSRGHFNQYCRYQSGGKDGHPVLFCGL